MNGKKLLEEIARRIKARTGLEKISDAELARQLGVTQPNIALWRSKDLTPRQVANLIERMQRQAVSDAIEKSVIPIVEFFYISAVASKQGSHWELFSPKDENGTEHPYLAGLQKRLQRAHGIYVFHDSSGKAIYAGKAVRQKLWNEMNSAYNRDRGEVQSIKIVSHPSSRVMYKGGEEKTRPIVKQSVSLYDIAAYVSAYEVADGFIGKFEALIVRAFANDLLNVRMENF